MNISEAYNNDDLRRIARGRPPRVAYDCLERGAEDDVRMTGNREALVNLRFRPRVLALTGCRNIAAISAEVLNLSSVAGPAGA